MPLSYSAASHAKLQPVSINAHFSPAHTVTCSLCFILFSYSPVVVTPEKTQHCPYDTGVPLEEWYFLKISTLLLHAAGETPSE